MLHWLYRLIINGLGVILVSQLIPGITINGGIGAALWAGFILALINTIIRPLVLIFTLPINILTLGLFTFVINAFVFWLTSLISGGLEIDNFISAFAGALLLTFISWLGNRFIGR